MTVWRWEFFEDYINAAPCTVTDAGPLLAPIEGLLIRRNKERELALTTTASTAARRPVELYRAGTVRRVDDTIEFTGPAGFTAVARGVIPMSWSHTRNLRAGSDTTKEDSTVSSLIMTFKYGGDARYTIEWIENFHAGDFLWPGSVKDETRETTTTIFGRGADAITLRATGQTGSGRSQCINLKVGDVEFYLGASDSELSKRLTRPGFILYKGKPDDATREKIRNCLSFALGHYLLYLGCAVLDDDSNPVSATAVSGYGLNDGIFELPPQPPAPVSARSDRRVEPLLLSRLINGLYSSYDELEFGRLSWAYWHAICAPTHIAAAHFGAAIEALQAAYVRAHPNQFQTQLVSDAAKWRKLQGQLTSAVQAAGLAQEAEDILSNKIKGLNNVPAGKLSEQIFDHLGIPLGQAEKKAWKHRNLAAHGESTDDDPVSTIRNTKLLRIIFHRLVLKMTNGSDMYQDYYTLDHPLRKINEPVP